MSGLLEAIRSRGHWQVVIRPTTFVEKRVPNISELYPIVEGASVQLRGWDFPHLSRREQPIIDLDWVGQETRWEHNLETWRLYQSGQFVHLCAFWDDWRDHSGWWPPDPGWKPGQRLGIGDALFRFTEIFEFAARLSMTRLGDESMHVEISLGKLSGRFLFVDASNRGRLHWRPTATIDQFPFTLDLSRAELVAGPREYALQGATELFKRFGWEGSQDLLRGWQSELGRS